LNDEIRDLEEDDIFAPTMFEGEQIDAADILDKVIVVRDYATRPSQFSEGDYAIVSIETDGEKRVLLTGAKVLMKSLEKNADFMPYRCRIVGVKSPKSHRTYYAMMSAKKKE